MWITVQRLEFCQDFFCKYKDLEDPGPDVSRIITEVLFLHNGPIYKFILQLTYDFKITLECLNKWILFLSRKGVKYILLENFNEPIQMPPHLFSCQESTYFKLRGFNLSIPPSYCGFKSLLQLELLYFTFELGELESLVSSCPLLEELLILHCFGCECIDLSSSTLKVLDIRNVPAIKSICLEKATNLIDLTLNLHHNCIFDLKESITNIQRLTMRLSSKVS